MHVARLYPLLRSLYVTHSTNAIEHLGGGSYRSQEVPKPANPQQARHIGHQCCVFALEGAIRISCWVLRQQFHTPFRQIDGASNDGRAPMRPDFAIRSPDATVSGETTGPQEDHSAL